KGPTPIKDFAPEVPPELIAVVDRLMQKTPEARFPHTADVIDALRPLAAEAAVRAQRLAGRLPKSVSVPLASNGNGVHEVNGAAETPRPEPAAAHTPAPSPKLPSRQSFRPEPSLDTTPVIPSRTMRESNPFQLEDPRPSLWAKLGTVGIVVGALLAAA